jgi:hypothetical protein
MTFQSKFLLGWTVVEWNLMVNFHIMGEYVKVSYVVEEMDLLLREEEGCRNGVDWCIAPTLYISLELSGIVLRRKILLLDRDGRSRRHNFHFATDSTTQFQNLTRNGTYYSYLLYPHCN